MIFFFDYSLIFVFIFFAVAIGIQAARFFQGIVAVIATIIFIAEIAASIYFLVNKINHKKRYKGTSSVDIIMTMVSSILCLFTSYLYLHDISGYGTGIDKIIYFIVALVFVGCPWLYTVAGWMEAVSDTSYFNYSGFVKEIIASGVILFIFFIL